MDDASPPPSLEVQAVWPSGREAIVVVSSIDQLDPALHPSFPGMFAINAAAQASFPLAKPRCCIFRTSRTVPTIAISLCL